MGIRDDLWREDRGLALLTDTLFQKSFTTATNSLGTVGTTSAVLLPANTSRKYASFVNDSDTKIYLGLGNPAVSGKGIPLVANGGSFEIDWTNAYTGTISAITTAANKVMSVTEGW